MQGIPAVQENEEEDCFWLAGQGVVLSPGQHKDNSLHPAREQQGASAGAKEARSGQRSWAQCEAGAEAKES